MLSSWIELLKGMSHVLRRSVFWRTGSHSIIPHSSHKGSSKDYN
jgi:hypothetical protein